MVGAFVSRPFTLDRLEAMHRMFAGRAWVRHDVDVSLEAALAMARWENDREIHATYYLMSSSPFYSWPDACEAGAIMLGLGHRLGYHWDVREPWPAYITPSSDTLVSFHCPPAQYLWRDFRAFQSAYAPCWRGAYYADSRGRFAHGDPEDHRGDWPVQVNLHCEWWMQPKWLDDFRVTPELYEQFFREPMEATA